VPSAGCRVPHLRRSITAPKVGYLYLPFFIAFYRQVAPRSGHTPRVPHLRRSFIAPKVGYTYRVITVYFVYFTSTFPVRPLKRTGRPRYPPRHTIHQKSLPPALTPRSVGANLKRRYRIWSPTPSRGFFTQPRASAPSCASPALLHHIPSPSLSPFNFRLNLRVQRRLAYCIRPTAFSVLSIVPALSSQ